MRSTRSIAGVPTVAVFALLAALAALAALAEPAAAQAGDELFNQTFDVSASTALRLDVADADVRLEPGSSSTVEVTVLVDASDPEAGQEFFDRMGFEAGIEGGELRIRAQDPRMGSEWWRLRRYARVVTVVRHPPGMSMRVSTGDGDIRSGALSGEIEIHTGDGDIEVGEVRGGRVRIETSDGDIRVRSVEATRLDVSTSDGDVDLGPIRSEVHVSSGDGDIHLELAGAFPVTVETGDGDVTVRAPADLGASLDLEGEDIEMDRPVQVRGRVSSSRLRGELGGGGPEIRIRTGDGEIRFVGG
jgi:hypothetical protein